MTSAPHTHPFEAHTTHYNASQPWRRRKRGSTGASLPPSGAWERRPLAERKRAASGVNALGSALEEVAKLCGTGVVLKEQLDASGRDAPLSHLEGTSLSLGLPAPLTAWPCLLVAREFGWGPGRGATGGRWRREGPGGAASGPSGTGTPGLNDPRGGDLIVPSGAPPSRPRPAAHRSSPRGPGVAWQSGAGSASSEGWRDSYDGRTGRGVGVEAWVGVRNRGVERSRAGPDGARPLGPCTSTLGTASVWVER